MIKGLSAWILKVSVAMRSCICLFCPDLETAVYPGTLSLHDTAYAVSARHGGGFGFPTGARSSVGLLLGHFGDDAVGDFIVHDMTLDEKTAHESTKREMG